MGVKIELEEAIFRWRVEVRSNERWRVGVRGNNRIGK